MAYSGDGAGRLIETVRELSLARTQDAVTAIVRRCARELTDADGATFVLRDGDLCFYADEDAISPLWKGQRFPMDMCISGWVMLNREPVVIEDIYADPRIPADAYRPTFVKSLAMVPIRPEAPVGAIGAYWAAHHHPAEDRIAALQALADSVSVTMENLQLCAMLEARVRELERSNQVKDQFLDMLSHELRTPLNAIVGWADLLAAGELPPEEFSVGIATIQRNVRVQARITDDLLDTTQIVSGNLKLVLQPLDLTKVLRSAIDSVKVLADTKDIAIELSLVGTPIGPVAGDPERLQQTLWHLLTNAVKFTPNAGRVRVRLQREGPSARIDVEDDGEGIPPAALPPIFDLFHRGDPALTRRHGGLGIGLTIVKYLVEAHGGSVAVASAGAGKGAVFTVKLPIATATSP
jgi:two-component system CheB/CheR fusion protein